MLLAHLYCLRDKCVHGPFVSMGLLGHDLHEAGGVVDEHHLDEPYEFLTQESAQQTTFRQGRSSSPS